MDNVKPQQKKFRRKRNALVTFGIRVSKKAKEAYSALPVAEREFVYTKTIEAFEAMVYNEVTTTTNPEEDESVVL